MNTARKIEELTLLRDEIDAVIRQKLGHTLGGAVVPDSKKCRHELDHLVCRREIIDETISSFKKSEWEEKIICDGKRVHMEKMTAGIVWDSGNKLSCLVTIKGGELRGFPEAKPYIVQVYPMASSVQFGADSPEDAFSKVQFQVRKTFKSMRRKIKILRDFQFTLEHLHDVIF